MTCEDPGLDPTIRAALCDSLIARVLGIDPEARPDLLDEGRQQVENAARTWQPEKSRFVVHATHALRWLRISTPKRRRVLPVVDYSLDGLGEKTTDRTLSLDLRRALGRLRRSERTLMLRFMEGHSVRALSHEYGVSKTALQVRVNRCLKTLRKDLVAYA